MNPVELQSRLPRLLVPSGALVGNPRAICRRFQTLCDTSVSRQTTSASHPSARPSPRSTLTHQGFIVGLTSHQGFVIGAIQVSPDEREPHSMSPTGPGAGTHGQTVHPIPSVWLRPKPSHVKAHWEILPVAFHPMSMATSPSHDPLAVAGTGFEPDVKPPTPSPSIGVLAPTLHLAGRPPDSPLDDHAAIVDPPDFC